MISVVIAAHNEQAVIGRCLDAIRPGGGDLDITVVANGCTDRTAEIARQRPGVRVLDLAPAGKPGALNAGDAVAIGFPRVYLDADVVLSPGAIPALAAAVDNGPLAVVPRRVLDVHGRPPLVRAYYAINAHLPAYRNALFGRGAIVLSEKGRARFGEFPTMMADDLFLDSLFADGERVEVPTVTSRVATPRKTADLVRRLTRVRAGNAALRRELGSESALRSPVRSSVRSSWLRDVVLRRPWLAPAGACYAGLTAAAELRARRSPGSARHWGRDESSRQNDSVGTGHG
jgi:glycosyltransferase involved in cell wall biosynthesis